MINGFALGGTPTVLVEQRFLQEMNELARGLDLDYSALVSALALEGFITMKGLVEAAADAALTADLDRVGTASPMLDLLSMRHETQYTRLFRS